MKTAETEKSLKNFREEEERRLAQYLSDKHNIPLITLSADIEPDAIRLIPEEEARLSEVAAFDLTKKKVKLMVRNLGNPNTEKTEARLKNQGYEVKKYLATLTLLERAWGYYKDLSISEKTISGIIDISSARVSDLSKKIQNLKGVANLINEFTNEDTKNISRFLEIVLAGALSLKSSDIHWEPQSKNGIIRYRIDGVLRKVATIDRSIYDLVVARIKLFAGMKLNIERRAQDGRFSIKIREGLDIEVRVSSIPEGEQESLVLRLLDPEQSIASIDALGLHSSLKKVFEREIRKPNGLILTTGPTGSGKTTTLYTFLKEIHTPRIKIITIENPVEYKLDGVVQTQITPKYSFATALKATMRQDPDVILVGEVRGEEVAKTAVNAALTGHVVFSTLHTNNAAGALPRLAGMGIDPKTFSSAINLIIAQRLVRKVIKGKAKKISLSKKSKEVADKLIKKMPEYIQQECIEYGFDNIYSAKDDDSYKGRIGIFEALLVDRSVEELMVENKGVFALEEKIGEQGNLSLEQDCLIKVLKGETTVEEFKRVLGITLE